MPRKLPILDDRTQGGVNGLPDLVALTALPCLSEYAVAYLQGARGADQRSLQAAAGEMGVSGGDVQAVETALLSVTNLYWEACKARLQEKELMKAMTQFTLPQEYKDSLVQTYMEHRKALLSLIGKLSGHLPHYHDLDWRIDVQLGRRSRLQEVKPLYLLRLDTTTTTNEEQGDKIVSHHLQADAANLKHLQSCLEAAVNEVKTIHCQRFARYIR